MLNSEINYIVSGLERSGTSVMMQMLHKGGLPVAFDESRKPDEHNPKGYFELAGGKIINQLMDGTFDMKAHRGRVVKVTAYGLKFLPQSQYKIVYMQRNIDEVINSMHKMGGQEINKETDKLLFSKLDKLSVKLMKDRNNIDYILVRYRDIIDNPRVEIERVSRLFGETFDFDRALTAVDSRLYRNRASS